MIILSMLQRFHISKKIRKFKQHVKRYALKEKSKGKRMNWSRKNEKNELQRKD